MSEQITIHYHGQILSMFRFDLIDESDWTAQRFANEQVAGLCDNWYRHKLITIHAPDVTPYTLNGHLLLEPPVGLEKAAELSVAGADTIRQLLTRGGSSAPFEKPETGAIASIPAKACCARDLNPL